MPPEQGFLRLMIHWISFPGGTGRVTALRDYSEMGRSGIAGALGSFTTLNRCSRFIHYLFTSSDHFTLKTFLIHSKHSTEMENLTLRGFDLK